jgi:hypothetical protein
MVAQTVHRHDGQVLPVPSLDAPNRFPSRKPPIGAAKGAVVVGPDGLILEHPLAKQPIAIPLEQVLGFAAGADLATEPGLVLARPIRILSMPGVVAGEPVAIVLRQTVHAGPFKYGADRPLGLSGRERREGLEVQLLRVVVADPQGLALALQAAGVRRAPLGILLREVLGEAIGEEREAILAKVTRQRRRARRLASFAPWMLTVYLAVRAMELRLDDGLPVSAAVQVLVASALILLLTQAAITSAAVPAPSGPPGDHTPSRVNGVLFAVACVAALVAGFIGAPSMPQPLYVGLTAFGAGGLGGLVAATTFRVRAATPDEPVIPPSRRARGGVRWKIMVPVVVLLVAVVAIAIAFAPPPANDLAKDAVPTAEELGDGWDQTSAGDNLALDTHICGSDNDFLPSFEGVYERSFDRRRPDGRFQRLEIAVLVTPSEADAKAEFMAVDSDGYRECFDARVEQLATDIVLRPLSPARVQADSFFRTTPDVGVPIVVDREVALVGMGTYDAPVYVTMIRMQVGRAIVRIPLTELSMMSDNDSDALIAVVLPSVQEALADD